ncbi:expressed unknown protein [Seminavis robusta]|uniref:Uncharacterized protein n=1 Tax=Seminavis robusta TaxID=568900 RepID=A0A9N8EX06_9STRA|nr:expressed unknown protein [Seminavis robusta]|eukprot:Sro2197_g318660.1 n/a (240) ;mRNA; r:3723-4442
MFIKLLSFAAIVGVSVVAGFQAQSTRTTTTNTDISRDDFLKTSAVVSIAAAILPSPAMARGRATLEYSYDRYTPRIVEGGKFYTGDLKKLVEKSDWSGIKNALAEPPKRTKSDLVKQDAGISERAAQAGQFSDARVIVACDLFASAFSDNSISSKTKKMKEQVDILRSTVEEMDMTAKIALGEVSTGGLFGIGGKKPSQSESAKKMRELYMAGGTAYNKYIFLSNDELPLSLNKLPYLR